MDTEAEAVLCAFLKTNFGLGLASAQMGDEVIHPVKIQAYRALSRRYLSPQNFDNVVNCDFLIVLTDTSTIKCENCLFFSKKKCDNNDNQPTQ